MALFKTTAQLKDYLSVDINTKFASLLPFITEAEQQFIIPLIGQTLYDLVNTEYNANTLSADNTALLPYIQRPLAYYAQLLSISSLTVTFGDRGIREHLSPESATAPRWKEEKLQLDALTKGDRYADLLLKFLEDNATDSKYASWYDDSTLNTKMSGVIVYKTSIATQYIPINESRRLFLKLKPFIKKAEGIVPKIISKTEYDALVGAIQTPGTLDEKWVNLLQKLYPYICKIALYMAMPMLRVSLVDGGLFLYSNTDLLRLQPASASDVSELRKSLKEAPFGYDSDEQELIQFMIDNVATYTLYAASNAYTGRPDPGPMFIPDNNIDNKYFSV